MYHYDMTLSELISEYKSLTEQCSKTDYSDSNLVRKHNQSVNRMIVIATSILANHEAEGIAEFAKLLEDNHNGTDLWCAIHILEKMSPNSQITEKALSIIRGASSGDSADAMGYQIWLENWNKKG